MCVEELRQWFQGKNSLLHNGNYYASIPVGHSVHLKECYENLKLVLNKLCYSDHKWILCGDLKMVSMLLGQQSGYTKFPWFLCEWDSRARKLLHKKRLALEKNLTGWG